MSNFIISKMMIPLVKLAYPKINWMTKQEVKTNVAERITEIKDDSKQLEFREILVEFYNWMCTQ